MSFQLAATHTSRVSNLLIDASHDRIVRCAL
jgi:hypothetical protein